MSEFPTPSGSNVPRKSPRWPWLLGGVGVFGLLVVCGGCCGLFWMFKGFTERHFANQILDLSTTQAVVGEIVSFTYNTHETGRHHGGATAYDVVGTQASGLIVLQANSQNEVEWAAFRGPDGNYIPLLGQPQINVRE